HRARTLVAVDVSLAVLPRVRVLRDPTVIGHVLGAAACLLELARIAVDASPLARVGAGELLAPVPRDLRIRALAHRHAGDAGADDLDLDVLDGDVHARYGIG